MKHKIHGDLMLALLEQLDGSAMVESFKQEMLPLMGRSAKWKEPLNDEQYRHGLAQIHHELPAFSQYLQTTELPSLPNT